MISIDYELIVDTDETERRLELLHTNVRTFGTARTPWPRRRNL